MTMKTGIAVLALAGLALAGCASMGPSRDAVVAAPTACSAKRFDVYFGENQAQLTDAARTAISVVATQLQGCRILDVKVLGLADATGTPEANLVLSQRRALAVAEALEAAGWPAPVFELTAAGDVGAETAPGVEEPLRRRAEVLIEAAPPR